MELKLAKRVRVKYEIIVKTGLHIGGSKGTYEIGGVDNPVIKNPMDNQPIIPGSSIKGKVRMLLELMKDGKEEEKLIEEAFGPRKPEKDNPMSRVIFRDLMLTDESKKELEGVFGEGYYTEIKAENSIDNVKGTAKSPRFIERVPAGAVFAGDFIIQYLEGDPSDSYYQLITKGFKLLENNYLGGNGSRGYGKIEYKELDKIVL